MADLVDVYNSCTCVLVVSVSSTNCRTRDLSKGEIVAQYNYAESCFINNPEVSTTTWQGYLATTSVFLLPSTLETLHACVILCP